MESDTHKALKEAVRSLHQDDSVGREERVYIDHSTYFIVDLDVRVKYRRIFYECETRPSIPRLRDKGRRRKRYSRHNNYVLVVPREEYGRDWTRLRGYFDKVMAYDLEEGCFTGEKDLRLLPWLQEQVEDTGIIRRYERLRYRLRWVLFDIYAATMRAIKICKAYYRCLRCQLGKRECLGEDCYWYSWRYEISIICRD